MHKILVIDLIYYNNKRGLTDPKGQHSYELKLCYVPKFVKLETFFPDKPTKNTGLYTKIQPFYAN